MSVTVLLPVYNGSETLDAAIRSVLRQDVRDWELLVVDDASSDDSGSIAERYEHDPRVRVVRHAKNVGLAATLNEGLELARNELVARLDQDDEALPERLRLQEEYMARHPSVAVAGTFVRHMGAEPRYDHVVELPVSPRDVARRLHRENCIYHPSVVLRRTVALGARGYNAAFKNAEDYELWLRLARTYDLANLDVPLLRYRFSAGGMTLGRKWEQLFYVYLAQEVNRVEGGAAMHAADRARERLAATDRRAFMRQVASGTLSELARLRRWSDGYELLRNFRHEIGRAEAIRLEVLFRASQVRAAVG